MSDAARRTPTPGPIVAFFDVDNTLMRGASVFYVGREAWRRRLISFRDIAVFAWHQFRFLAVGENRQQELSAKATELTGLDGLQWHCIGQVQTNKARALRSLAAVVPLVVHSLDRVRLAGRVAQWLRPAGYDPDEPGAEKHVQRGGSFLCSDQYCIRYKAGSRGKGETSSASNNLGFRCVKDATNKSLRK